MLFRSVVIDNLSNSIIEVLDGIEKIKGRTIAGGVLEAILHYVAAGDYLKLSCND